MNQEIKDIITEWIYEMYKLKNFNNVAERSIWEAEVKEKWDQLDRLIDELDPKTCEDYEEEIEELEEQVGELASRNEDLMEENTNLRQILTNVSEAINVTWN